MLLDGTSRRAGGSAMPIVEVTDAWTVAVWNGELASSSGCISLPP
jgi:hypothetical protein